MNLELSWQNILATEYTQPYFTTLITAVDAAYSARVVYPPQTELFAAFSHCPLLQVRVVIIGQDPYHGAGQANGLAFSVADGVRIPPSLKNIYKEIASDIGTPVPPSGNLTRWATQGVLLLNSSLTVEAGQPASHAGWGWEQFTDVVITTVSKEREHVVFLLWGAFAITKRPLIDETKHLVLTAPHPSPLSAHRGFLGCKHFSQTNAYMRQHGQPEIIW